MPAAETELAMTNELLVFITAMIPVAELRGAIPLGLAQGLSPAKVFVLSVIGNMVPIPFLILFSRPVIKYLKRFAILKNILSRIEHSATKKAHKIKGYVIAGLFAFVAIPLPGTGAWTGSLIAAILNLRLKYALLAIYAGVIGAGVLVTLAGMGIIHIFGI